MGCSFFVGKDLGWGEYYRKDAGICSYAGGLNGFISCSSRVWVNYEQQYLLGSSMGWMEGSFYVTSDITLFMSNFLLFVRQSAVIVGLFLDIDMLHHRINICKSVESA